MNITVTPLGDRHKCGQTRRICTDTISYIEKPRDYQIEAAFSELLDAMAQWGLGAFCQVPPLLEAGAQSHTQELVRHTGTFEENFEWYFYRAGAVIFLGYLLGSTDLHGENIIACGDMPVLVDLETLLSGKLRRQNAAWNVLRSHLVCSFARKGDKIADISGFGGIYGKNLPFCQQKVGAIYNHIPQTLRGFQDAYGLTIAHRAEISSLLENFSLCRFRQILRPTATYAAIIDYLQALPEERCAPMAKTLLERAYLRDVDTNRLEECRKVADEEIRAVLAEQIPLFHVRGDGTALLDGDAVVQENFLLSSPVETAKQRLSALSAEDMARQVALLENAIRAADPSPRPLPPISGGCFAPGEQIGQWISQQELPGGGWYEITTEGSFALMGLGLYSGISGLGCMYAALYRKTGKAHYLQQTELICRRIQAELGSGPVTATNEAASLGSGIGGIALAFQHIAELTEQPEYGHFAAQLLHRLTPGRADGDYLNGVGALPVAYARCGVTPDGKMAQWLQEILCQEVKLTGFAHGAAGRAVSLSALQNITDFELSPYIKGLIYFENQHFIPKESNWQDIRNPHKIGFMSGWCSGAPGIGMARQAMNKNHPDLAAAKAFLQKQTPSRRHSLCCGTASRLMAASRLGVQVDKLFAELRDAETEGKLRLLCPVDTPEAPLSLMQGAAGAAYALAMYQDPLIGGMLL